MDVTAWLAFTPQLIVATGIIFGMLTIAWRRSHRLIGYFSLAVITLAILATLYIFPIPSIELTQLVKVDLFAKTMWILVLIAGAIATLLAMGELETGTEVHDEFYILLLLTLLGAGVLVTSQHYASLFLGFELLSISLVGLTGYFRNRQHSVEASFKYLILSASASSFMLLGIAFIYSQTGTLNFSLAGVTDIQNMIMQLGVLLLFSGIAFKLSLVPFHYWTPDVYQGASSAVTFILASVSKTAMFVALYKCLVDSNLINLLAGEKILLAMMFISIASMIVGNCLALGQQSIKRLLAYSSIAHMGYLVVLLMVLGKQHHSMIQYSASYYLFAYLLANAGLFSVLCWQEKQNKNEPDIHLCHWRGLIWRNPSQGIVVLVSVLGLAGIPLTAGFIGKFYLIISASHGQLWWMLSALIVGSGIALGYYMPLIFALFKDDEVQQPSTLVTSAGQRIFSMFIVVTTLVFGLYPDVFANFLAN
ncbi:NADH-quinone oxidoreductase subunit N [Thalassotalea marina]|uniref:NADH-quinone oxidoreductase subunit N n=1 Tax=Thalassotalea marina TaxID=1673741 RepID=A0A919EI50_9GAMM|nr:NADH-quinone oxidoreductase subunit N [Thalassotalea marina]GHF81427.1 NADH-quinone oxidoreductase subunit N [Thalassotalea marina]